MALQFLYDGYFAGKVGIGTESPDAKLSISDILGISGTGNDTYGQIDLVNTQTGASGDEIGPFITFRGKRGGVDSVVAAYGAIGGVNTGTTGNSTGAITFLTKNAMGAAQDLVEQMRISTGGNVGIGTISPDEKLEIEGTGELAFKINNTQYTRSLIISQGGGYSHLKTSHSSGIAINYGQGNVGILSLFNNTTQAVKINANGDSYFNGGNVGIGTSLPQSKLEVIDTIPSSIPALGLDSNLFQVGGGTYGTMFGSISNGNGYIQQQRFDGTATAYNLLLQPNGGNVGIGRSSSITARLFVEGPVDTSTISTSSTPAARINNGGAISNWIGSNGYNYGYIQSIQDDGSNNLKPLSLQPLGGNVGIGTTGPDSKLHVLQSGNGTSSLIITEDNARKIKIGRDSIQVTDLSDSGTNLYLNQGGGNVSIPNSGLVVGATGITYKFEVHSGATNVTSMFKSTDNQAWISIQDDDSGTYGALIGTDSDEGENFVVANNSVTKMLSITNSGSVKFHNYNSSNQTGTPTYLLGTDGSGNIVKTNTVPGSAAGPYLPLAGGDMTGQTTHGDGVYSYWGDSNDLQIGHDGGNSYIIDRGVGDLLLYYSDDFVVSKYGTSEISIRANQDSSVELFFDNSGKLATTSSGIAVTGDIQIDSALLSNQENTDVDTGTETVASVAIATYTAAFFDFVIKKTTNVRSGTVYACHDGTSVAFTETSTQDLGDTSDVTLSVDISGGNMRLLATTTSDDWSVKSLIRAI